MPRMIIVSDSQYSGILDLVEAELRELSQWEKKTYGSKNASIKNGLAFYRRLRTRLLKQARVS